MMLGIWEWVLLGLEICWSEEVSQYQRTTGHLKNGVNRVENKFLCISAAAPLVPLFACLWGPRLTISFSLQIPVFSGNEISFRNFGKFRQISVNFDRFFLNFEFSNEIFRKIPNFFFPVTSENEIFRRISAKFRRNFKPSYHHANQAGPS